MPPDLVLVQLNASSLANPEETLRDSLQTPLLMSFRVRGSPGGQHSESNYTCVQGVPTQSRVKSVGVLLTHQQNING